jgi:hypothetical protein
MNFYLILKVLANVIHQEGVALVDKLLVKRIVHRISLYSVLYEKHGQIFNTKISQKPLVFSIDMVVDPVEKQEISLRNFIASILFLWHFDFILSLWFSLITFYVGLPLDLKSIHILHTSTVIFFFLLLLADFREEFKDLSDSVLGSL